MARSSPSMANAGPSLGQKTRSSPPPRCPGLLALAQKLLESLVKRVAVLLIRRGGFLVHTAHGAGQRQDYGHPILVGITLVSSNGKQGLEELVIPGVPEICARHRNGPPPLLVVRLAQ